MSKHDYEYPSDTLALVVGGSGGIGRAVSYALADAGIAVHVHGLHDDRVHAVVVQPMDVDRDPGIRESVAYGPADSA